MGFYKMEREIWLVAINFSIISELIVQYGDIKNTFQIFGSLGTI